MQDYSGEQWLEFGDRLTAKHQNLRRRGQIIALPRFGHDLNRTKQKSANVAVSKVPVPDNICA